METVINSAYLYAAVSFILGLKFMGTPSKAKRGNFIAAIGMIAAIVATVLIITKMPSKTANIVFLVSALLIGTIIGKQMSNKVEMTGMPQLVSLFNALGGISAFIISLNEVFINIYEPTNNIFKLVVVSGIILGGASFTGSIVAYYKLSGKFTKPKSRVIKRAAKMLFVTLFILSVDLLLLNNSTWEYGSIIVLIAIGSLIYGVLFSLPIGGADMPVLISLLNAVTGVATIFSGIVFQNPIMVMGGVLVGATGVFLTIQMCKAMNRSLKNVLFGSSQTVRIDDHESAIEIQQTSSVELSSILAFSKNVAIIPGYGMAVSQAQQTCYELHKKLIAKGVNVNYIIHPVAGRMPGHMNVLLAEANIDYKYIKEMDEVNDVMERFDVALIIGANDVVNPLAEDDPDSVIYGMPIIKAYKAKHVVVMKRGMSKGYSGIRNTLFEKTNCKIFFGDANDSLQKIIDELKAI